MSGHPHPWSYFQTLDEALEFLHPEFATDDECEAAFYGYNDQYHEWEWWIREHYCVEEVGND